MRQPHDFVECSEKYYTQPMKFDRQHVDSALRQIGVIVVATGLVTGVLEAAQASGAAMIALAGWALVLLGAQEEEQHDH